MLRPVETRLCVDGDILLERIDPFFQLLNPLRFCFVTMLKLMVASLYVVTPQYCDATYEIQVLAPCSNLVSRQHLHVFNVYDSMHRFDEVGLEWVAVLIVPHEAAEAIHRIYHLCYPNVLCDRNAELVRQTKA